MQKSFQSVKPASFDTDNETQGFLQTMKLE